MGTSSAPQDHGSCCCCRRPGTAVAAVVVVVVVEFVVVAAESSSSPELPVQPPEAYRYHVYTMGNSCPSTAIDPHTLDGNDVGRAEIGSSHPLRNRPNK